METINIILVILLIALTAFFVASEYSIIRVRVSRINQLASEGNKNTKAVKNILSRLDEYLSACQLGTALTSMALGWLGESTVEKLLHPLFVLAHIPAGLTGVLSFLLAFLILTYFEVVVGELVPKTFAIQIAEPMALFFARPITIFYKMTYPLNWLLSRSSRVITGLFGLKKVSEEDAALSEAELRLALSEGFRSGEITPTEYRYLNNVFDFDDRAAQEIMVPRIHIRSISHQATVDEFMELIEDKVYNFLPVAENGDRDRIIGMIRVKEALHDLARGHSTGNTAMSPYIHPVLQVIETIQARDPLIQMQKRRISVAVLVDEYGGTSGLVTLEDIMEEIVGDIPSYTDTETETPAALTPLITKTDDHRYILKSQALIHEVNRRLETDIEAGDVYTIGGWMLSERFDIQQGEKLTLGLWEFTVLEKNSHQIDTIEAVKKKVAQQENNINSE